jgi:hypothetical protein
VCCWLDGFVGWLDDVTLGLEEVFLPCLFIALQGPKKLYDVTLWSRAPNQVKQRVVKE